MDVYGAQRWTLGGLLGSGGFGRVFAATGEDGEAAAVKLVPKQPGAGRELLFADTKGARNVMPVLESGETADSWVIVMPLADRSLAEEVASEVPMELGHAVAILRDVATALMDLAERDVVHRDLKPANVLAYRGSWVLADFGISRFAEASTAPDTHKHSWTPPYNPPERWRGDRATPAADVYALGVMAYELVKGARPFSGPTVEDFRQQHLHESPPALVEVPSRLAALIDACLDKAPQARPTAADFLRRLERAAEAVASPGAASLARAFQASAREAAEQSRRASAAATETERRDGLLQSARRGFANLQSELREVLLEHAPGLQVRQERGSGWSVSLGKARLVIGDVKESTVAWGRRGGPALDVIAHSEITLHTPQDRIGYSGRGHSLWYCDAQQEGVYGWYETAFMDHPLMQRQTSPLAPFSLQPNDDSGQALGPGMGTFQVAWPFTRLDSGDLDEFSDRWAGWFATGAGGALRHPIEMPERSPEGSWRTS